MIVRNLDFLVLKLCLLHQYCLVVSLPKGAINRVFLFRLFLYVVTAAAETMIGHSFLSEKMELSRTQSPDYHVLRPRFKQGKGKLLRPVLSRHFVIKKNPIQFRIYKFCKIKLQHSSCLYF